MDNDGANFAFLIAFMLMIAAPFFYYVRAGMVEAEAEWRAKMRARFCIQCGYSLRGNTSGICPECGNRIDRDARP